MLARALGVCLRQALRSVALILFPLAFVALFTWATAGSTSGNTSDPMRATAWLWLGAHLTPFNLHAHGAIGHLTYLPILALVAPVWAIKRNFPKVREVVPRGFGAQLIFGLCYAALAELIALASFSTQVSASLIATPLFAFLVAVFAATPFPQTGTRFIKFALSAFAVVLGICSLIFSASLVAHYSVVKSITTLVAPGVVGGVLFTLLQLLYLPNLALASLGYFTNSGFTFGAHSLVSAKVFALNGISAIPVLGALPTGKHPIVQYGVIVLAFTAVATLLLITKTVREFTARQSAAAVAFVTYLCVIALFSYLSSGELLTSGLNPVGIRWVTFIELNVAAIVTTGVAVLYLPELVKVVVRGVKK